MTIACPNPPHPGSSETIGGDPLQCPCCKGTMKPVRQVIRRDEIEFFPRLRSDGSFRELPQKAKS